MALAGLFLALATSARAATPHTGAIELGGYGGFGLLSSDNQLGNAGGPKQRPGSGPVGGLRAGWHVREALALEVEADYTGGAFADSGLSSALLGWRASALWAFAAVGAGWRPFAVAGAGSLATVWKEYGSEHDADLAAHAGVGMQVDLGRDWGARADVRYLALDGAEARISHNFAGLLAMWVRLGAREPAVAPSPIAAIVEPLPIPQPVAATPETASAKDEPPAPVPTVVVRGETIEIRERVLFAPGTADIQPESHGLLDAVAAVLAQHLRLTKVAVEGHTDDVGDAAANLHLSQARAEAVVQHLVARGVAVERLAAHGFGSTRPLCGDVARLLADEAKHRKQIEACRDQNRRVQFRVIESDGAPAALPGEVSPGSP